MKLLHSKWGKFRGARHPLGAPFSHVPVTWDDKNKSFQWDSKNTKLSYFHNDGVIAGYVNRGSDARLLETSSPALLGQSGGPVLTNQGTVIGLQSRNTVLESSAHSPLETGLAASHSVIANFLAKHTTSQTVLA